MRRIAPFSPTQVSGCQLWLDAADSATISLSGSTLTQWNDKSGNANNTNTVGGSPSYASNFVTFNGTSDYVVGPYVNATQYLTAFVVGSVNFSLGYGKYYRLLSVGSTAANDYDAASYAAVILHNPNTTQIGGYRNSQTNYVSVTTNSNFLIMNQYDGTNATLYLNGTAQTPVSSTGSFNTSSYSIGRDVGNTDGGSYQYWPGTVGEVIIYNLVLTNAQRQNIESYLAQKWGLKGNLPNGHPGFTSVLYPSSRVQSLTPMIYASTFTPTGVAGCSLWLDGSDASTITQSSGSVSQWNDKSGNAYNFTQGSAGNRPTFVSGATNGLSLLRFSGSGQYLGGGTTLNVGTSDLAIFAVCKYAANAQVSDNGSQGTYVFAKSLYGPANNRIFFGLSAMGVSAYFNGSSYESSFSSYHCVNFVTARASGYTTSYANGTQFAQITGAVDNSSWTSSYNMVVGGYNDPNGNLAFNGLYMNGDICEIIIYIASITNTQRQTIEGYLMWKWGLQANIPVGNLYQTVSPNPTNIFNVSRPLPLADQYPTPIRNMVPVLTLSYITTGLLFHLDAGNPASYSGSGSTWYDLAGSGLTTTLYGSPTYSSANGGYLSFAPASSQYGQTSASLASLSVWSVEVWHYYNNTNNGAWPAIVTEVFSNPYVNFALGAMTAATNNVLEVGYHNNGWYTTSTTYTLPSVGWYHIVGTYDGTNLKLYINNVLTQTAASSTASASSSAGIRFMRRWDSGDYWGGYLAIVRIYNRALQASEISTNYAGSKGRFGLS